MTFKSVGLPLLLITTAWFQCLTAECIKRPNFTIEPSSSLNDVCYCDSNSSGYSEQKPLSLYPYISYEGKILPNNSAIELNYAKVIEDVTSQPIGCHTNLESREDKANWFNSANNMPITSQDYTYVNRSSRRIDLIHSGFYNQLGVYCCKIPVDAGNGCEREETICVGVYAGNSYTTLTPPNKQVTL